MILDDMALFHKLKKALTGHNDSSTDDADNSNIDSSNIDSADNQSHDGLTTDSFDASADDHLQPITNHLIEWVKLHDWNFTHHEPETDDKLRTHHIVIGFSGADDDDFAWNCVIRIAEKNQLVTMYGVLLDEVPETHHLNLLVAFNQINQSIHFGSVDFDLQTGNMRAKLSFDAEFTHLSMMMLNNYMQALVGLTEIAHRAIHHIHTTKPSQNFQHLLTEYGYHNPDDDSENPDLKDDGVYYMPTHLAQ